MAMSNSSRFALLKAPQPVPPTVLSAAPWTLSLPDRAAADQIAESIVTRFPEIVQASNPGTWLEAVATALYLALQTQFGGRDLSAEPELTDYLLAALYALAEDRAAQKQLLREAIDAALTKAAQSYNEILHSTNIFA